MSNVTPSAVGKSSTRVAGSAGSANGTGAGSASSFGGAAAAGAGKTTIEDGVVAKIAGIAAREVPGVYALGSGAARAIGAIRDALNSTDLTQGVSVEVGEKQVAVDLTIVAEYPESLQKVADDVRTAVYKAMEDLVGMDVAEVNITVNDVHLPSDDDGDGDEGQGARVQ